MKISDIVKFVVLYAVVGISLLLVILSYLGYFEIPQRILFFGESFLDAISETLFAISFFAIMIDGIYLVLSGEQLKKKIVKSISSAVGRGGLEEIYLRLRGKENVTQGVIEKFKRVILSRETLSALEVKVVDALTMKSRNEKKSLTEVLEEIGLEEMVKVPTVLEEVRILGKKIELKKRFHTGLMCLLFLVPFIAALIKILR